MISYYYSLLYIMLMGVCRGCTVEFMDSGKIEGKVTGGSMAKTCTAEFDC